MSNEDTRHSSRADALDHASIVELENGYAAATGIDVDGETKFWILDPDGPGGPVRTPAHEQLGPLPGDIRAAVNTAGLPRCGSTKRDGQPCRSLVHQAGDHCRHHTDAQQLLF